MYAHKVSDPNNMRITITNDGATILKSVPVENPAAKVLVEIAKTQDDTVGDGTTRFDLFLNIHQHVLSIFPSILVLIYSTLPY